jgi:geranylgeranyl pyrophosphate synthase
MQTASIFSSTKHFVFSILKELVVEGEFQQLLLSILSTYYEHDENKLHIEVLPSMIAESVGFPDNNQIIPFNAAWQLIRLTAKLFDDVEDGSINDQEAQVINLATSFLFVAHYALEKANEFGVQPEVNNLVRKEFTRACLSTCAGQHQDLSFDLDTRAIDPDSWHNTAMLKSGALYSWACQSGAFIGSSDQVLGIKFREFGFHLGIFVQIADDYNGVWGKSEDNDLSKNKYTLPISYARFVSQDPEWETFCTLLSAVREGKPYARQKALEYISTIGGQKFILATAWLERQSALKSIEDIRYPSVVKKKITALFTDIFPALGIFLPHDF